MTGDWKSCQAEGLAEAWNQAGVKYAVANGLDDYPAGPVGRDLDVLVAPDDLRRAVSVSLDYCRVRNCDAVVQRLGWIYWIMIVARTPDGIRSLQVDLFDHLQWEFSWILDGRHLERRARQGPFFSDPWSHVAKRLMINLLSQGTRVFEVKPHYLDATADELGSLPENLKRLAGREMSGIVDAVRQRDVQRLAVEAADLRRAIRKRSWTASGLSSRLWSAWQKQWAVNLWPRRAAPVIAVNGRPTDYFKALVAGFTDRFRESFVYCAVRVESPLPEDFGVTAALPGWFFWWKRELIGDRRRSALQVVNVYENHAVGCALLAGAGKTSLKGRCIARMAPRPDLSFVVAGDESELQEGNRWQGRGLVDRVIELTGEIEADVSSLLDAVFDWHQTKAATQRERWEAGQL